MPKLDDVLKAVSKPATAQDHSLVYLDGLIESDHDSAYFRLYRLPHNRGSYLLLKRSDVVGDPYEWHPEEVRQAGVVGAKMFRVALRTGVEAQRVSVKVYRLREATAGSSRRGRDPSICCCDDSACTEGCIGYEEGSCGEHGQYPCNPGVCGM